MVQLYHGDDQAKSNEISCCFFLLVSIIEVEYGNPVMSFGLGIGRDLGECCG